MMNEKHLGSSLDDFLAEEGRLTEAETIATKRAGVSDRQTDGRTAAIQDGNGAPHEQKPREQ